MKAEKCRYRLSTIQQSYPGHMDEMLRELDELEWFANIAKGIIEVGNKGLDFYMWDGNPKNWSVAEQGKQMRVKFLEWTKEAKDDTNN